MESLHLTRDDRFKLLDNGSLAIGEVRSGDTGDYVCRAENEFGADEITVSLIVQGIDSKQHTFGRLLEGFRDTRMYVKR